MTMMVMPDKNTATPAQRHTHHPARASPPTVPSGTVSVCRPAFGMAASTNDISFSPLTSKLFTPPPLPSIGLNGK